MPPRPSTKDRIAGAVATALVLGSMGGLFLWGMVVDRSVPREPAAALIDVDARTRPTRPPPPPVAHRHAPAARAPAPPNLNARATALVIPPAIVRPLPPVVSIVVAPVADSGAATSSGASDRPGAGAGGNGAGFGGAGNGDGGETPPRLRRGKLKFGYLPQALREAGAQGTVGVRYSVEVTGRIGTCEITASSGNADLDAATCRLIREHYVYYPSRDAEGLPVRSLVEGSEGFFIEHNELGPPRP